MPLAIPENNRVRKVLMEHLRFERVDRDHCLGVQVGHELLEILDVDVAAGVSTNEIAANLVQLLLQFDPIAWLLTESPLTPTTSTPSSVSLFICSL